MYIPSAFYRKKALAALKGHWQTALLIALIVNLPTLMMQSISVFTGNDVLNRLQTVMVSASRDGVLSQQTLLDEIRALTESTLFWSIRGLELLAWLITPCLTLGMYKWLLDRLDGQEQPVRVVFCRVRLFFKAIGLQLMIVLNILLWALPGLAVELAALIPLLRAGTQQEQLALLQRSVGLSLPMALLILVPCAMAALRCAMSEFILAEKPETGILACIRQSKALMKDQKRALFLLLTSFLLWYLVEMLVTSLLSGVPGLVVQMLASLALTLYASCAVAAFYRRLTRGETEEPVPEALN